MYLSNRRSQRSNKRFVKNLHHNRRLPKTQRNSFGNVNEAMDQYTSFCWHYSTSLPQLYN